MVFSYCMAPSATVEGAVQKGDLENENIELMTAPSLLILNQTLEERAQSQKGDGFLGGALDSMPQYIVDGEINATSTFAEIQGLVTSGLTTAGDKVAEFVSSLQLAPSGDVSLPSNPDGPEPSGSADSAAASDQGIMHVDYKKYALKGYVQVPSIIQPFLDLPFLDHYLVCGLPSMAKSCGLEGYRDTVPKSVRAAAPFLIVIDEPGKLKEWKDDKYIWVEFHLGDVFKLDVRNMKTMDDYVATLSKKAKWNFKDRQKKFNKPEHGISWEMVPVPQGDIAFLDTLWPLYKQTGDKNGFTVLNKEEFYSFHTDVPNLVVMMIWDAKDPQDKKLVSFCTGVRWNAHLLPMWCGTDYSNELNRTCSTYFNMLYNYVRIAIEDPTIDWVDLGASRRTAKTAIGFKPYPSSGYFRCKNAVMEALVESMMKKYYKPEALINDP